MIKSIFKLSMLGLAIWGFCHIKMGQETVLDKGKQTMQKHNITIDKKGWEKLKALFPSFNTSSYTVFSDKRNG